MPNDPQFIDEFKRIGLANGIVRIELGVLPSAEEGQQPLLATSGTLVMSLEGFIRSAATIDNFLKQLVARGVVRREQTPSGTATPR